MNSSRSRTPFSPTASTLPPNSLPARYDTLTKSALPQGSTDQPVVIDLGGSDESDDDLGNNSKHFGYASNLDHTPYGVHSNHGITMRPSQTMPIDDDDGLEEAPDPDIAAIEARARARAAAKKAAATSGRQAPVAQLFIASELPDTAPLMVKVRIDSTIERPREAWCARQKFTPEMTKNVFFTWRGTRLYDSTTIKRLGIKVDDHGNVSVDGDSNIYDDQHVPKVHVEAWTDETLARHKKELALEAEEKRKAVEASPIVEAREPTPEPTPAVQKLRLILKAKGMEEFKIQVNPDTTFEHLTNAFRQKRNVDKAQPLTLMFDGDRLSPMDTVQDVDLEDMDAIDVMLK
jgi:hypothetical protein